MFLEVLFLSIVMVVLCWICLDCLSDVLMLLGK